MGPSALRAEPNPHVHIAICDRLPDGIERSAEQMFRRYNPIFPERGGCRKDGGSMTLSEFWLRLSNQRKLVVGVMNTALEQYGYADRVDHRTLRERGIARNAERYLGPAAIRLMSKEDRQNFLAQCS